MRNMDQSHREQAEIAVHMKKKNVNQRKGKKQNGGWETGKVVDETK